MHYQHYNCAVLIQDSTDCVHANHSLQIFDNACTVSSGVFMLVFHVFFLYDGT